MRRQISTSGGAQPIWAANGREVFFRRHTGDGDRMQVMAVGVATEPTLSASPPHVLFEGMYSDPDVTDPVWAVMPDGKHFLVLRPPLVEPVRQIQVVLNWFEELKRRVPAGAEEAERPIAAAAARPDLR